MPFASFSAALEKIRGKVNPIEEVLKPKHRRQKQSPNGLVTSVKFSRDPRSIPIEAEQILDFIPDFLAWCADKELAESTLSNYCNQLVHFQDWYTEFGPTFDHKLTREKVRQYARWLRTSRQTASGGSLAHNTRAGCLRRLKHYFKFCWESELCDADISNWVPQLTMQPRVARHVDSEGILKLFEQIGSRQQRCHLRDQALLALLFSTGARRSEIFHVRIEDIKFFDDDRPGSGFAYMRITKMDKPRAAIFCKPCAHLLKLHIEDLGRDSGPLWDFERANAIYRMLETLCRWANLPTVGPHDLRKLWDNYFIAMSPAGDTFAKTFLNLQVGYAAKDVLHRHYLFLETSDIREHYISPLEDPKVARILLSL